MASSSIWGSILKGAGTGVTQGVSMLQQMMQQEQQQGNQDRQFNAQQDRYAQIKENMKIDNALAAAKFENTLMLQEESRQKEMVQGEMDIDKQNIEYEEKAFERRQGAVDLGRKREKEDLDMEVTRAKLKKLGEPDTKTRFKIPTPKTAQTDESMKGKYATAYQRFKGEIPPYEEWYAREKGRVTPRGPMKSNQYEGKSLSPKGVEPQTEAKLAEEFKNAGVTLEQIDFDELIKDYPNLNIDAFRNMFSGRK